jgi:hypothetical protein
LKVEYKTSEAGLDVKFIEEHSVSKWLGLVAALLFLLFFIVVALTSNLGVMTYFGIALLLAIIFNRLYVLFGMSGLQLTEDRLILTRRLFSLRTTRSYQRRDVEKLGYAKEFNGYENHQDSGLSLMVKQNVTPVLFAKTILPEEATAVFEELSKRCQWLAPLIRPVGTLPY